MEGEDDPVEALLQLAQNGREGAHAHMTTVMGNVEPCESMESDEGIVSDQSNEFEDSKKRLKVDFGFFSTQIYCDIIYIECLFFYACLSSTSLSPRRDKNGGTNILVCWLIKYHRRILKYFGQFQTWPKREEKFT